MKRFFLHSSIWLLLPVFLCSCKEDDYVYPSVKMEFITAEAGSTGALQSFTTDEGERLSVAEDRTNTKIAANETRRMLTNYEPLGEGKARIYALASVVSPVPLPPDAAVFREGIKTDPAGIQSIWLGRDYLNMVLLVKAQSGAHLFHFVEEGVTTDPEGNAVVNLLLYHDAGNDTPSYTKRAYLSVPLRQYATAVGTPVLIYFRYYDLNGELKQCPPFTYIPSNN